jgi:hypothetical protein
MTWRETQKLFNITIDFNEYDHPYQTKEIRVIVNKFGWRSVHRYAADLEFPRSNIEYHIIRGCQALKKLEEYMGIEITYDQEDLQTLTIKK